MGIKEWWESLTITAQGETIPGKGTNSFGPQEAPPVKKEPTPVSAKDAATAKGEPWVSVMSVNLDVDNVGNGSFDLDWNEIFVARLVKAGYKGKDDITIVDQWFTDLCRNIITEQYEQEMADPTNRHR